MRHLICFGNELHGDDGFGPAVHRRLAGLALPPDLRLYQAGNRGLDALVLFEGCDEAILVDAAAPAGQPGRVGELDAAAIEAASAAEMDTALPGHGTGVGYLLRALAALGGPQPRLRIVAAEMAAISAFRPGLSIPMAAAVEEAVVLLRGWLGVAGRG